MGLAGAKHCRLTDYRAVKKGTHNPLCSIDHSQKDGEPAPQFLLFRPSIPESLEKKNRIIQLPHPRFAMMLSFMKWSVLPRNAYFSLVQDGLLQTKTCRLFKAQICGPERLSNLGRLDVIRHILK